MEGGELWSTVGVQHIFLKQYVHGRATHGPALELFTPSTHRHRALVHAGISGFWRGLTPSNGGHNEVGM